MKMLIASLVLGGVASGTSTTFVVAPNGDDANPGTLAKPFESLTRARDAVRQLRRRRQGAGAAILLRGGLYCLDKPLDLTLLDTSTKAAPLTIAAYANETPIVSGGRPVTGWTAHRKGLWKAQVDGVKQGRTYFRQLFVAKPGATHFDRRYRPSIGLFVVAGLTDAPDRYPNKRANHRNPQNEFHFHDGDIKQWENLEDVEVVAMHDWSSGRLHIDAIDFKKRIVRFTDYPHYRVGHWYPGGRNPYLVENVKEALGKPGQWCLDRPTGTLYYHPLPGEDMNTLVVIAPRLEHLVRITGDVRKGKYVEHVTFRGLTFAHTAWKLAPHQYAEKYKRACRQGFVDMPSAIELKSARHCRFERCTMANLGSYAIDLGEGCHENDVVGNLIVDCGSGGVKVGVVDRSAKPPIVPTHNRIRNNLISDIGLVHYSAHGIWGGMTSGVQISHNVVRRTLYSSVAVGWSHSTAHTSCRDNVMEYNHIYDVLLLLDHGGALYTLGNQPGTVIRGNLIHDTHHTRLHGKIRRPPFFGGGLAFDDGSKGFLIEGNIIYDTAAPPDFPIKRSKGLHTARNNHLGVSPKSPKFPHKLAARAGLEPTYKDLEAKAWRVAPPPVLSMALPKDLKPIVIVDDFERLRVGRTSRKAYSRVQRSGPKVGADSIKVTDETAASGKHSLEVVDAPGLSKTWVPYLSYNPHYDSGTARVAFDLRVGQGAYVEHAWRGNSNDKQFSTGLRLRVKDGRLLVQDKELLRVPMDTWVHFEVTARLGKLDPGIGGAGRIGRGVWTLGVTLPGREPKVFKDLAIEEKGFEDLNWVGFISLATQRTHFYLDNVRISCE
jgi:parallel beta helix pectate lyase-like protein